MEELLLLDEAEPADLVEEVLLDGVLTDLEGVLTDLEGVLTDLVPEEPDVLPTLFEDWTLLFT